MLLMTRPVTFVSCTPPSRAYLISHAPAAPMSCGGSFTTSLMLSGATMAIIVYGASSSISRTTRTPQRLLSSTRC